MTKILELFENKIKDQTEIEILGWVKLNRNNNKLGFLIINDGTKFDNIQVVYKANKLTNFSEINSCRISSVVKIKGKFCLTANNKQPFEIQASKIEILDQAIENYPLQKKEHSFEFLRGIAHLRAKTNTFNAVFRIRSSCAFAIHKFFNQNNFIYVNTPIITGNDAEGSGETFIATTRHDNKYNEDFFAKKASLTVSGQLHVEGFAQAFRNVYTFGPIFRAENSNTTKHAAEFWMIEPEVAFDDLNDNMDLAEYMIKHILNYLFKHNLSELKFLNDNIDNGLIEKIEKIRSTKFIRISYTDGLKIIKDAIKKGHKFENTVIFWGMDLQTEHEKYLCEIYNNAPTFIVDYPKEIKAFYMKLNDDNKTVAAYDLLVPGIGELIGGSQRENCYQKILKRCQEMYIPTNDLQWYLNLRQYGYYKCTGFGLGFERLIMYVTGMENIRDVIPFPRVTKDLLF